jgi:hypothetical protein
MNYQAIYDRLINFRRQTPATGYVERHHILPKSLGGSNDASNLVVLTGREHWVAHLLLWKITKNPSMTHACHMMAMRCEERGIPRVRNSRMYASIREKCAKSHSSRMKSKVGAMNPSFGSIWISNIALKISRKTKLDIVPDGWVRGRTAWLKQKRFTKEEIKLRQRTRGLALAALMKAKQKNPRVKKYSTTRSDRYLQSNIVMYNDFYNSGVSLSEFCRQRSLDVGRQQLFARLKRVKRYLQLFCQMS